MSTVEDVPRESVLYRYTQTPYLSALNSLMLLSTPMVSPAVPSPESLNKKVFVGRSTIRNFLLNSKYLGPTNRSCLLFGFAQALGTGMLMDGDIENGSGFIAAWSTLYLIVAGRGSINALSYGKIWPLALSSVALTNGLLYGRRFITSQF